METLTLKNGQEIELKKGGMYHNHRVISGIITGNAITFEKLGHLIDMAVIDISFDGGMTKGIDDNHKKIEFIADPKNLKPLLALIEEENFDIAYNNLIEII
jgi:hypothetical protein